jgi:hypothetical protein
MSHESLPITAARFADAIADLPLSSLHLTAASLRNSLAHLEYSNAQLEAYARPADPAAAADQDCLDAIEENKGVMRDMNQRLELLRVEAEKRGLGWGELLGRDVDVPAGNGDEGNGDADTQGLEARVRREQANLQRVREGYAGAMAEVAAERGQRLERDGNDAVAGGLEEGTLTARSRRLTEEERDAEALRILLARRAAGPEQLGGSGGLSGSAAAGEGGENNPWTDGTFQTGRVTGGRVVMDEAPVANGTSGEGGDVRAAPEVNGVVDGVSTSGSQRSTGGRLSDEEMRRRLEEMMRGGDDGHEGADGEGGLYL